MGALVSSLEDLLLFLAVLRKQGRSRVQVSAITEPVYPPVSLTPNPSSIPERNFKCHLRSVAERV